MTLTPYVGLAADARVLIDKARMQCQSHRLTVEDPVTVEFITRHIAGIKQVLSIKYFHISFSLGMVQKYTQSNGRRPFGLSMLIAGFDQDGSPRLYQTEPSGIFSAWKV